MAVPTVAATSDSGAIGGTISTIEHVVPSGWSSGDMVIAQIRTPINRTISAAPDGWNLLEGPETGGQRHYWYWKFLDIGDPNENQVWTLSTSGSGAQVVMLRIAGNHASSPIDTSTSGVDGSAGTSHVSPTVTTTADECLILRCMGSSGTLTASSGDTGSEVIQATNVRIFSSSKSPAGSTGTATYTTVSSVDVTYATIAIAPTAGGDVTAPTLSSPTAVETSDTTADLGVDTNEGNGTLYWVVTQSSTGPSAAQVKAGQDHTGSAADDSGSQAVSGTGTQAISGGATGLTAETTYYAHFMHEDAATNQSDVETSASFETDPAPEDPLTAGTASFVSSGPAGISVIATDATGGSESYTYQWERNEDGGSFSDLTGETALACDDDTATTPGVLYGYRVKYDDGVDEVTSNTVTASVYEGGPLTGGSSSIFQSSVIRGA